MWYRHDCNFFLKTSRLFLLRKVSAVKLVQFFFIVICFCSFCCCCCCFKQILDVHNVLVVVSRWYGGILLGPDRFKHINNCARNILVEYNYVHSVVSFSHLKWRHLYVNLCKLSMLDEARRKLILPVPSSDCFDALTGSLCTDLMPY